MNHEPQLHTDPAVLVRLGERLARYRLQKNTTQARLAQEAGVSKRTVERLEAGESTQLANLIRVLRALGLLERLDLLTPEVEPSPLDQLKQKQRERKRASGVAERSPERPPWEWGDES